MTPLSETRTAACGCVHIDHNGEMCQCCGLPSHIGFSVPDEIWQAATGITDGGGLLCLMCFAAKADAAGVEWCRFIMFWPVSLKAAQRAHECNREITEMTDALVRQNQELRRILTAVYADTHFSHDNGAVVCQVCIEARQALAQTTEATESGSDHD